MDVEERSTAALARIASAIGEPARTRMLCSLLDGRARTSTELAVLAEVTPSTASVHLQRLLSEQLVRLHVQGKHRYYDLAGPDVARALEDLSVLAGAQTAVFEPSTPSALLFARTCYDHIAGALGVRIHDRFAALGWLMGAQPHDVTPRGARALESMGLDVESIRNRRRKFAYPCLDWSERRPHLAGALGAALLALMLKKRWFLQGVDSRALEITRVGRREMETHFGLRLEPPPLRR